MNRMFLKFFLLIGTTVSQGAMADKFKNVRLPTPKGLGEDVAFWERIFKKYTTRECVFHDRENLQSVFLIQRLPQSKRKRQAKLKQKHKEIKRALSALAKTGKPGSRLQRRVVRGTPKELRR